MKTFRKEIDKETGCTTFSMNETDSYKGIQITFGDGWVRIMNTYSFFAANGPEFKDITEEEFNEAFEQAISQLTANVLAAA